MKAIFVVVGLSFALTGCGLKVVNKEAISQEITKASNQVKAARGEFCSDEVTSKIDSAEALLQAILQQFQ